MRSGAAVPPGVDLRGRDGVGIHVDREHAGRAELERGDREDAGAGADVEHGARRRAPASASSSRTRQPSVLPWWPVPKARPGSMIDGRRGPGARGRPLHGGSTRRRSPTSRGGKDCCQALAHASSSSGRDLGLGASTAKPSDAERRAVGLDRAQQRGGRHGLGKKARSRGGTPGGSSSTTPSAPCSQRKFVSASVVSAEAGTVSCQNGIRCRRASSSARRTWTPGGRPRPSDELAELLEQLALARGELRRHLDDHLVHGVAPARARADAACPCPCRPSRWPGWVPGGHRQLRAVPSSTGTSTSSPRAAWGKVSGSSQMRCGALAHEDLVRLARGSPRRGRRPGRRASPPSPSPVSRS